MQSRFDELRQEQIKEPRLADLKDVDESILHRNTVAFIYYTISRFLCESDCVYKLLLLGNETS